MPSQAISAFLRHKIRRLSARAGRLARLTPETVGIRSQDRAYAPSQEHFRAANMRLGQIDKDIRKRLAFLHRHWKQTPPQAVLLMIALVEREIDRARRAFGMFFELFSQRGSLFAPTLAAHDAIAVDCYAAIRRNAPLLFGGRLIKPLTYMEHGYSPATMRRGVALSRLLGEPNPFPVVRIPWDRDNPWQAVFIHEVGHNIQADLRLWQENRDAVGHRMLKAVGDPLVTTVYRRWHKEIFADMISVLLGGPACVWGMLDFLAHPPPRTLTYKPGGAHPTGYLRGLILGEMLRRLGFEQEHEAVQRVWRGLFNPSAGHRIPPSLLNGAGRAIRHVVDEIVFQTRRNLAQRALVDIIPFTPLDQRRILAAARTLVRGRVPTDVPPRFLVGASFYAGQMGAPLPSLARNVIAYLSTQAAAPVLDLSPPVPAAA